jgi:hypothetical protein
VTLGLFVNVNAQPSNEVVDTCANVNGSLRLIQPFGSCAEGEQRVRLREPELDKDEQKPEDQKHLLDLQRRVKDLEDRASRGRLLGSRVVAPFEVVNEAGVRVFRVEEAQTTFYNSAAKMVASVTMLDSGGFFKAYSATAPLEASIGALDKKANVLLTESDRYRLDFGRNDSGQYALRVYEPGGKMVAGIGQSTEDGAGLVTVADTQGRPRAQMTALQKGGGALNIFNNQGKSVATLLSGESGNGMMQLFNRDGVTMVEAGVNTNNIGVVRAGPAGFHPGVGILGLPGSYIAGKAAQ